MITLLLLVRATYISVILHAHPVRGESLIQRNAKREVATAQTSSYATAHEVFALYVPSM